jgi:hypothetical protein
MLQSLDGEEQDVSKTGLNDQSFLSRNLESMQNRGFASRVGKSYDISNHRKESI